MQQSAGDSQFLLHALRECPGSIEAPFPQPQHAQVLLDLSLDIFYLVQLGENAQVVLSGQVIVHARRLGQHARCAADVGILFAEDKAVDRRRAAGRPDQAGQHAHGGGLPGAVRTEAAEHLALAHVKAEAFHRQNCAEFFGQVFCVDHFLPRWSPTSPDVGDAKVCLPCLHLTQAQVAG